MYFFFISRSRSPRSCVHTIAVASGVFVRVFSWGEKVFLYALEVWAGGGSHSSVRRREEFWAAGSIGAPAAPAYLKTRDMYSAST